MEKIRTLITILSTAVLLSTTSCNKPIEYDGTIETYTITKQGDTIAEHKHKVTTNNNMFFDGLTYKINTEEGESIEYYVDKTVKGATYIYVNGNLVQGENFDRYNNKFIEEFYPAVEKAYGNKMKEKLKENNEAIKNKRIIQ